MPSSVRQGEQGGRLYLLKTGHVQVVREDVGVDTPLAILTRSDFFGEIALLEDVPRTATCRAIDDTELYALERKDFQALLQQSEVFGEALRAESVAPAVDVVLNPAEVLTLRMVSCHGDTPALMLRSGPSYCAGGGSNDHGE